MVRRLRVNRSWSYAAVRLASWPLGLRPRWTDDAPRAFQLRLTWISQTGNPGSNTPSTLPYGLMRATFQELPSQTNAFTLTDFRFDSLVGQLERNIDISYHLRIPRTTTVWAKLLARINQFRLDAQNWNCLWKETFSRETLQNRYWCLGLLLDARTRAFQSMTRWHCRKWISPRRLELWSTARRKNIFRHSKRAWLVGSSAHQFQVGPPQIKPQGGHKLRNRVVSWKKKKIGRP